MTNYKFVNSPVNKVMIVGDVHGQFGELSKLISDNSPDIILQAGDFGYWPKFSKYTLTNIKNYGVPIYWCDGNHEDFESIKLMREDYEASIIYMKRMSVLSINSTNILFIGGAESIDKHLRTPGIDWFPEESITQRDLSEFPNVDIDIVVSHTAPMEFSIPYIKGRSPSRIALSTVLNEYKPKQWFFGHFHKYYQDIYDKTDTLYTCLNMVPEEGCFEWVWNK